LATKDKVTLLKNGKLVLLVDLDQTLIHTTTENVHPDMKVGKLLRTLPDLY
jgi:predicted HAD superfamily phosphohydrolase YqeG